MPVLMIANRGAANPAALLITMQMDWREMGAPEFGSPRFPFPPLQLRGQRKGQRKRFPCRTQLALGVLGGSCPPPGPLPRLSQADKNPTAFPHAICKRGAVCTAKAGQGSKSGHQMGARPQQKGLTQGYSHISFRTRLLNRRESWTRTGTAAPCPHFLHWLSHTAAFHQPPPLPLPSKKEQPRVWERMKSIQSYR